MSDPFFFLWAPDPSRDGRFRSLQHYYVRTAQRRFKPFQRRRSVCVCALPTMAAESPAFDISYVCGQALPVYSILFALWRFNSIRTIKAKRLWREGGAIGLNYLWMMLFLPLPVAVGHVFLAGVMTATIVTVRQHTHTHTL